MADVLDAVRGNPLAVARLTSKVFDKVGNTKLTDAQRSQVVRILVSDDSELVKAAMTDQRALTGLIAKVRQISNTVASGTGRATTVAGAMAGGAVTGGLLSPSGPQ